MPLWIAARTILNISAIRYENGERMIPLDIAVLIAKLYNVSIDYLANMTDDEKPYKKGVYK